MGVRFGEQSMLGLGCVAVKLHIGFQEPSLTPCSTIEGGVTAATCMHLSTQLQHLRCCGAQYLEKQWAQVHGPQAWECKNAIQQQGL